MFNWFVISLVLSTFDSTIVLSIPETVPVKCCEAKFAFKSKAVCVVETGLLHRCVNYF
jgi:hypothetical protein